MASSVESMEGEKWERCGESTGIYFLECAATVVVETFGAHKTSRNYARGVLEAEKFEMPLGRKKGPMGHSTADLRVVYRVPLGGHYCCVHRVHSFDRTPTDLYPLSPAPCLLSSP